MEGGAVASQQQQQQQTPALEEAEEGVPPTAVETSPDNRYTRYDQVLGRGAFKTVWKAFDEQEGLEVAWNQVQVNDMVSSSSLERDRLFAEIRVLKQLKHKNIMSFYDSWLDTRNLTVNFVTELFTSGTLRQYRKKRKVVDDTVLKRWAWQILQGLVYLHGHNPPIIHRDLKCDNIFVNGASGVVKLGDLGLATLWRGLTAPQSVLGTPEFMAPELYEEKYNEKVDVYSFGMCMLELATMEYPYAECKNAAQIYRKVTQGVLPSGMAKVEDQALREFIELCIRHDPEQRPEARQLLKHSFFESIRTGKMSCPGVDKAICERNCEDEPPEGASDEESNAGTGAGAAAAAAASSNGNGNGFALVISSNGNGDVAAEPRPQQLHQQQSLQHRAPGPDAAAASASHRGDGGALSPASAGSPDRRPSPPPDGAAAAAAGALASGSGCLGTGDAAAGVAAGGGAIGAGGGQEGEEEERDDRDRDFYVSCRRMDESNKLNFQLKFAEPVGGCKTIEFAFDLNDDTAAAIAHEMMEDLSLSAAEAQSIATKIRQEVSRVLGTDDDGTGPCPVLDSVLQPGQNGVARAASATAAAEPAPRSAFASPPPGSVPLPPALPARSLSSPSAQTQQQQHQQQQSNNHQPSQQQQPLTMPGGAAAHAGSAADLLQLSRTSSHRSSSGGAGTGALLARSDSHTPVEESGYGNANGKPPSIHQLIAAMKEVHEQERQQRAATKS